MLQIFKNMHYISIL